MQDVELPIGTIYTPNGLLSGLWALERPKTSLGWGSGCLLDRIESVYGKVDIVFGKRDNIDEHFTVDIDSSNNPSVVADWKYLPFKDKEFKSGYWDPPYVGKIGIDGDVHYDRMDNCLREICRVLEKKLFILSPLVYPCPDGWERIAVIAITYGPNKVIRCLQGFKRIGSDNELMQRATLEDW